MYLRILPANPPLARLAKRQWAKAFGKGEFLDRLEWAKRQLNGSDPKTNAS